MRSSLVHKAFHVSRASGRVVRFEYDLESLALLMLSITDCFHSLNP